VQQRLGMITVELHYFEPQKCEHLVLTNVLLRYWLHSR